MDHNEARRAWRAVDILNPSLFVGSSSEGLRVARALQEELDQVCEPLLWSQGAFEATGTTIGSLLEVAQTSDFAALVVTPDDSAVVRSSAVSIARDNVVFELGLFLAALGPRRVFIIQPRDLSLTLPSDLAGVTTLDYRYNRADQNLRAAVGPAATEIRDRIASEGPLRERQLAQLDQEAARFWLKYGKKIPQAKDAARRLLARLPERTSVTLERLAASLDTDLMVSSFGYIAQDSRGATYPERAGALLSDRPPTGSRRPDGSEVKAVRVIDKPISRVSEPDNPHGTAVPGREPPRLLIEGTGQPPPDRAKPNKPDLQRAHQTTERSRTRRG